jgi:hypothetical protein
MDAGAPDEAQTAKLIGRPFEPIQILKIGRHRCQGRLDTRWHARDDDAAASEQQLTAVGVGSSPRSAARSASPNCSVRTLGPRTISATPSSPAALSMRGETAIHPGRTPSRLERLAGCPRRSRWRSVSTWPPSSDCSHGAVPMRAFQQAAFNALATGLSNTEK